MSDLDVIIDRLTAAGISRAHKVDKVPARPGFPYVVASLDTGQPLNYTAAGTSNHLMRRISVQLVGQTWESVADMARLADLALKEVELSEFPGKPFTRREMATDVREDNDAGGLLYALHTYQF